MAWSCRRCSERARPALLISCSRSSGSSAMAPAAFRDDPWRRVPWLLPMAVALTLLSLMGFLKLLAGAPFVVSLPLAVDVDVVELAPNPPAPQAPPTPPPPSEPPPLAMEPPPPPPTPEPLLAQALPPPPMAQDLEPTLVPDGRPPAPPAVA